MNKTKTIGTTQSKRTKPKRNACIRIERASENNLKDVTIELTLQQLIVVTGVSGSGKSSLVMDVLYAEGQRRFVESMTSYARQFLINIKKPKVESIKGLCPTIAIQQNEISRSSKSTVGTLTEIQDYLKLVYARIGRIYSPISKKKLELFSPDKIAEDVLSAYTAEKVFILFQISISTQPSRWAEVINVLTQKGFSRAYIGQQIVHFKDVQLAKGQNHIFILVDRIIVRNNEEYYQRIKDSAHIALFEGDNEMYVANSKGTIKLYSNRMQQNDIKYLPPTPSLFSFNSPHGVCPTCNGYGTVLDLDQNLIIPDTSKSLYDKAVAAWRGAKMSSYLEDFIIASAPYKFPIHQPIDKLSAKHYDLLWKGNKQVLGIYDFFKMVKRKSHKIQYRVMLSRYQGKVLCHECQGYKLRKEALYILVQGKHIGEISRMPANRLQQWFESQVWEGSEYKLIKRLLQEINQRLNTLINVGLGYLTLEREAHTLSGGETQRIRLTKFLGSNLTQSLYLLDEPTIGLHQRDTQRLIKVLKELKKLGNTVIVIEHDEDIIRSADHIVDMGPLAGKYGGKIVAEGDMNTILQSNSLTAKYLKKEKKIERKRKNTQFIDYVSCNGATLFNLKDINVRFPVNALSVIRGPSGSGKSTLMQDILYPAVHKKVDIGTNKTLIGQYKEIKFPQQHIEHVEWISQRSISKLSRSNPISYIKAYDDIRALFARLPMSKQKGLTAGAFSFNTPGGRCEECKGEGVQTIEMQFLPAVKLRCELCKGKRFSNEILEVTFQGFSINDILEMSIRESLDIFASYPRLIKKLQALAKVGLGYVRLGQSTTTLSGGELQRLKLASFLTDKKNVPTLFFLDEPTIGLHFEDVANLVNIFDELIDKGHTIVVIEHNQDIIRSADWIIELGPGAGEQGGEVMFCGKNQH